MNSAHKEVRNLTNLVKTTRRRLLGGAATLTVLIALAALGSPATAFAQDSIQSKAVSRTPEGSWLYTVTIPTGGAPIVFLGTETYSAGGGYVEARVPGDCGTRGVEEHRKRYVSSDLYEPHLRRQRQSDGLREGAPNYNDGWGLLQRFRRLRLLRCKWERSRLGHVYDYSQKNSGARPEAVKEAKF